MKVVDALNTAVDSNTAEDIVSVYRSSVKRVLIAPYKCIVFAITSCLLLGTKYTKFVLIATAMCLMYSGVGLVLFLSSWDVEFLGYVTGGLLTILFVVTVLRKDSGHITLIKEAEQMGKEQEPVSVKPVQVPVSITVPSVEELRARLTHKAKPGVQKEQVVSDATGIQSGGCAPLQKDMDIDLDDMDLGTAKSVPTMSKHVKPFIEEIDLDDVDLDDLL